MGKSFEEVMVDCCYRTTIATGVYHCKYTMDDCLGKYCPAIGNSARRLSSHSYYDNGEPGDSRCPTCGSVVMSDEIELPNSLSTHTTGFIYGAIGAIGCMIVLWAGGVIQF